MGFKFISTPVSISFIFGNGNLISDFFIIGASAFSASLEEEGFDAGRLFILYFLPLQLVYTGFLAIQFPC